MGAIKIIFSLIGFALIIWVFVTMAFPSVVPDILNNPTSLTRKIFGFEEFKAREIFIGKSFNIRFNDNVWGHFGVSFWAGILLYISYLIAEFWAKEIKKKDITKIFKNPYESEFKKTRWLGFIAGSRWKVILFAVGYTLLTQLPITSRILQIITLNAFLNNFIYKVLALAFVIGYLPTIIQYLLIRRLERKYAKMGKDVKYLRPYMQKIK